MLRWLYIRLIWLHPASFRRRFGDDMLDDFDRSALQARSQYLADALVSLARQWLLRPEFRIEPMALKTPGMPLFETIEIYRPRPAAMLQGGLSTFLLISLALQPPRILPIARHSMTGSDLNTMVKLRRKPFEAWLKLAGPYFISMPVLTALDADQDMQLSPWEIRNAPAALRALDSNHDGKLTPEECGLNPTLPPHLRRRFMNYHPVLAALDADHDGEISAWEIEHAVASLRKLDYNLDGHLTADELIPFEMALHAGLR
jgi:hypothetical protein